ncbi:hypothetical protein HBE96_23510 [Clostridium sp. P21]|uniref:BIG2 domain-containing protein n=1 Tax=Clostridium muellerianum TaxID=2716538 RepID=A0A7Y0HPX9_9CLOT|nr:Ig-like domain-containing protein [Clostridium muellerianum]NMM65549.1 hypothetical protein [Clostridium muellerianum]
MNNIIENMYKDNKRRFGQTVKVTRADFSTFDTIVIIKEYDNGNNSLDDKRILADVQDNIRQGDIIQYGNNTYIILLQEETVNNIYCKYVARRCDNIIKMYIGNKLAEIPCVIETGTQNTTTNQYMTLPNGNIKVTIQDNSITKMISNDRRFLIMGLPWKVVGFTSENKGVRYVYAEKTEFDNAYDDKENEIADYWKYNIKHNYSMTIAEESIEIEEGKSKQLVVSITDTVDNNTTTLANPTIIYTSSNTNIVTINNTGVLNAVAAGDTSIKVQFEGIEKIINIKVVKPLPIVVTYQFKTITLDGVALTTDITMDKGTSKQVVVKEITKTTTQGTNVTTETITNPVVAYSSNNSNVTVDSTGKIQAVAAGSSIITIGYENIKKDINVIINDVVQLTVTGKTSVALGRSTTYTSNMPVIWSVEDVNNSTKITTWVTITSQNDTSCTIKVTDKWIFEDSKSKYFNITAVSKDNPNINATSKIKISAY